MHSDRKLHTSLIVLPSESYSNPRQKIKEGSDADHRSGMIPLENLLIMKLLTQNQAWAQLLSILTAWSSTYICVAQRQPGKWEWLACCSMCLSAVEGLWSRINCRISWFLGSFYCCTFFILLQGKQKRSEIEMSLSSGKLPVLRSLLGMMPALHSCDIFLTLSTLFRNWGKSANQRLPNAE